MKQGTYLATVIWTLGDLATAKATTKFRVASYPAPVRGPEGAVIQAEPVPTAR